MNSVLSYIAGLLVLLLFAALVGPSIVDWNGFRHEIEAQISNAVGRPVSVGGDINFVILPAPRFSLQTVSVESAPQDGSAGPLLAQVGTLEGEIALAPLLRGEIEVTRIGVLDFSVNLTRDENDSLNWLNGMGSDAPGTLDPEAISLDAAHFENGTIFYHDVGTGRDLSFSDITGDLKAVSLLGPLRFDGQVRFTDQPYTVSTSVGAFGGDRAFPVNFTIEEALGPWRASFTGLATDASLEARLDGTILFKLGGAEGRAPEENVEPVLSLQAEAVINRDAATLREIELTAVGSVLKGSAEIAFETVPTLVGQLSGARLLADKLILELEQMGTSIASLQVPEQLAGSLDLQVGDVQFGALNASNLVTSLTFDQGKLGLQALSVEFPGDTKTVASGVLSYVQDTPRFDGSVETTIGNLPAFSLWLENRYAADVPGGDEAQQGGAARCGGLTYLRLKSDVALQSSLWQAYSLSAIFGGDGGDLAPMTGGVSFARRARPALGVELDGPLLDLDCLGAGFLPTGWEELPDLATLDASIVLSAAQFRVAGQTLHDFGLTAVLADGLLSIEKFEATQGDVDQTNNGRISLSGSLRDIGRFATGGVEGTVSAPLLTGWARSVVTEPVVQVHSGVLNFNLRGEREEDRHQLILDLSGTVDGSAASLEFKQSHLVSEVILEQTDATFSLRNPVAADLIRQIGLGTGDLRTGDLGAGNLDTVGTMSGEGEFRAQVSGAGDGPLDTNVRLRAGQTSLSATGTTEALLDAPHFIGRFEVSSGQLEDVFSILGSEGALVDLIAANGRQGAVIAGGALDWMRERTSVSELEAVAGTFRVSGSGAYSQTQTVPRIDAAIELGRLTLDPLFATEDGSPWSASPLNWQALADLQGAIDVSVSSVEVAGLSFAQVEANASLADGVLSFTPVTAQFAGGRLTMGARFEGGEGVPGLGLTVALEDAGIGAASKMVLGVPHGEGVATASLQIQGQGRSMLGLVSTLSGKGTLALGEGHFSNFDLPAFRAGLDELETMDGFVSLVDQTLQQSVTSFEKVEGMIQLEEGILSFVPETSVVAGASETNVKAFVDLVRLEADVESEFILAGEHALPPMTMVLAGPLRDTDRRTDTLSIQSAIAQVLLVREMEEAGVEELPEEIRDLIQTPVFEDSLDAPLDDVLLPDEGNAELAPTAAGTTPVPPARPSL